MNEIFFHDAHVHLDLFKNMNEVMSEIERKKSYTIAVTNLPDLYRKYIKEYNNFKYIRFALGFHPELITKYRNQMKLFDEEVKNARYIGEIGLDKQKNSKDYENQKILFEHLIQKCRESGGKIVSIHSRNAVSDILKIIGTNFNCRVIMHWFSGTIEELNECIKRGFFFSINYKMIKTKKGKKIIENIPIDRMLIESDEPLASGKNNYDFLFIKEIIEYFSDIKNIQIEEVNKILKQNFSNLLK